MRGKKCKWNPLSKIFCDLWKSFSWFSWSGTLYSGVLYHAYGGEANNNPKFGSFLMLSNSYCRHNSTTERETDESWDIFKIWKINSGLVWAARPVLCWLLLWFGRTDRCPINIMRHTNCSDLKRIVEKNYIFILITAPLGGLNGLENDCTKIHLFMIFNLENDKHLMIVLHLALQLK